MLMKHHITPSAQSGSQFSAKKCVIHRLNDVNKWYCLTSLLFKKKLRNTFWNRPTMPNLLGSFGKRANYWTLKMMDTAEWLSWKSHQVAFTSNYK